MYFTDTIAAISTPCGEGGIGVIRISGSESVRILEMLFKRVKSGGLKSHRFYYGTLIDYDTGVVIDDALAVCMLAPKSFTREDVVEIQCHSGTLIMQKVLSQVLRCGARLAEPGEFTRRAFLNGRIDLLQAESVIDLIRGKTEASLALASSQRDGLLSDALTVARDRVRQALVLIEAYLDFPEEDLGERDVQRLTDEIDSAISLLSDLISTFDEGKALREGVSVLIAGKPNTGKSSLLNSLLKDKRAIVTSIPGTTRDVIEEVVSINGLPVRLLDTAGIRHTDDPVEAEGVRRALHRMSTADLVLFVVDGSQFFDADDFYAFTSLRSTPFLLVINKSDLPQVMQLPAALLSSDSVIISTETSAGMQELKDRISAAFLHGVAADSRKATLISRVRHRDAIFSSINSLEAARQKMLHTSAGELIAIDLRDALDSLGQVTGETTPDDILDLIFGEFCVGK